MIPSSGVTVTAVTQLRSSEIRITVYSERVYSPVASCDVPIAAKASTAMIVAPSSGQAVCCTVSTAARTLSTPCCSFTSIPSTTTMALSTSIPSAMISAPREMRSSITPMRPMKRSSTTTTMATACSRLTRKLLMAVVTALDWRAMIPTSIPSGI